MGEAAVRIGKEIGYINAGTIEFLVDKSLNFYFLEMNTRIQVEHPVTEMVTGIDIVEEQIRIAEGNRLRIRQEEVIQQGHAIECRIYAEDPMDDFRPSPGMMTLYREPEISGIRIDTGTGNAMEVNSSFDPMIAKLIVKGRDRNEARNIMAQALNEYVIHGIATNIAFLERLLRDDAYISNAISTGFCDTHLGRLTDSLRSDRAAIPTIAPVAAYLIHTLSHKVTPDQDPCRRPNLWETIGYWRNRMEFTLQSDDGIIPVGIPGYSSTRYEITLAGEQYLAILSKRSPDRLDFKVGTHRYSAYISEDRDHNGYVSINGHIFRMKRTDLLTELITASQYENPGHDSRHITSPMPGKVIRILVKEGEEIKKGQPLIIIEAMKMENTIVSPGDRVVKKINAGVNDRVETTTVLIEFEE
jgi:acetyl/propionyl-CoA carboxylase alpha subunit